MTLQNDVRRVLEVALCGYSHLIGDTTKER
jgi:hypothetical protein